MYEWGHAVRLAPTHSVSNAPSGRGATLSKMSFQAVIFPCQRLPYLLAWCMYTAKMWSVARSGECNGPTGHLSPTHLWKCQESVMIDLGFPVCCEYMMDTETDT